MRRQRDAAGLEAAAGGEREAGEGGKAGVDQELAGLAEGASRAEEAEGETGLDAEAWDGVAAALVAAEAQADDGALAAGEVGQGDALVGDAFERGGELVGEDDQVRAAGVAGLRNGLSPEENQELFTTLDLMRAIELVMLGLGKTMK